MTRDPLAVDNLLVTRCASLLLFRLSSVRGADLCLIRIFIIQMLVFSGFRSVIVIHRVFF